ncbi:hypothetical protein [Aestuariivita sp.]|jgi:hypothetical protein|uniref:hypothetical protein n=1 Tax=Aestuariivita sp. TaxID=1872407 RepID=UPI00216E9745|nr:hypothetical protein [Aestuariivita sp.]MCE8006528.1 hypothetical protein [Aestuariivita sp.]
MDADLALILGMVLGCFALVGMWSAITDGRGPRASAITVLIAGGLIVYALTTTPDGYTMAQIPDVFFSVLARFLP